jgi:endonuclease/exonuclease/phosphatase family metal-dependent hydrolase
MKMNCIIKLLLLVVVLSAMSGCCSQQTARYIQFPDSQQGEVKAMTFNIRVANVFELWDHWAFRKNSAIETIVANAPDIIGLQEAKLSQVRDIRKVLPQYSDYSIGRVNGRQKGETCGILYRTDRFSLLDSGTFWFSDTPQKPASRDWGNIFPRICSWVHLADTQTGEKFYVYNMHLDVFSQNSRARSVELLTKTIAARKTADPFIVMGDLNMESDNPAMAALDRMGCRNADPDPAANANVGTRHEFLGSCPRIDHVRISEGALGIEMTTDRRRVDGRYPSDHYPVIARVLLSRYPRVARTN